MKVLNITADYATPEQVTDGAFEPSAEDKAEIRKLLLLDVVPETKDILVRVSALADIVQRYNVDKCMIGGPVKLRPHLEEELYARGITPLMSFIQRKSVETVGDDGKSRLMRSYEHVGWAKM